jgi:hypothetical protein
VRIFNTVGKNTGSDITYATSATLGDSFTINTTGVYSMQYSDVTTGTNVFGISKNANATILNNAVNSEYGSNPTQYISINGNSAGVICVQSITANLAAGDVIRAQVSATPTGGNNQGIFRIVRVN